MRKILLILGLFCALPLWGAIAHDADSNAGNSVGNVSSFSWAHTCTGSNLALVVRVYVRSQAGPGDTHPTSITYNGVGLTEQQHIAPGAGTNRSFAYIGIWYLKAPATGSNTIAVTFNDSPGGAAVYGSASSFTGVNQTTPIDSAGTTSTGTTTPVTISVTTANANAWIVDATSFSQVTGSGTFTGNSPQVRDYLSSLTPADDMASSYQGPVVTPAATAQGYTPSMTIFSFQMVAFSLNPAAGAATVIQRRR